MQVLRTGRCRRDRRARAITDQVRETYGLHKVGVTDAVVERFYAISVERRLKHPAVVAVTQAVREELFANDG